MKLFKIVLLALAFAVNLLIAPPSWADPDLTAAPNYAEVTQAIDSLLNPKPAAPSAVKPKPEEVQQQLSAPISPGCAVQCRSWGLVCSSYACGLSVLLWYPNLQAAAGSWVWLLPLSDWRWYCSLLNTTLPFAMISTKTPTNLPIAGFC
jgi:hypothetical protein